MTRTLLTAVFLTLFSHTAWGLTESEFSQALSVAKLDAAVLKVRDNCQSQIGAVETSRECKCAIHYVDFVNETAFSIQYERCLKGLAAADKGEEFIKSLDDWKKAIEPVEKPSADTSEPKNGTTFTLADIDKIRSHVATCWAPPMSLTGANQPIIDIKVTLGRIGEVLAAEVADKTKTLIATNLKHRVTADEAIRTVFKCSPFPEPENGFGEQTNFIFSFDPRFLN